MDSKPAVVIDFQGYKVELILVDFIEHNDRMHNIPQGYILKEGESLVFAGYDIVQTMSRPRWNGERWEETATREEIEAAKPKQQSQLPTEAERLHALESAMLAFMMGGMPNV